MSGTSHRWVGSPNRRGRRRPKKRERSEGYSVSRMIHEVRREEGEEMGRRGAVRVATSLCEHGF